jgi:hypothetical protein
VTVCIAARSGPNLVGASDRMLTSGDIQFEPPLLSKLTRLSSSIGILQSGDAAFHSEIMWGVVAEVQDKITAHPTEWWLVSDVADLYVKYRNEAKRKRAEAEILAPLGHTVETFIKDQHLFKDGVADQITRDLINYEVPDVSVLVCGIDMKGPHIYVVDNGYVSCNDIVGFAAIGIGSRHAASQFMIAKHPWNSPLADTALLTYTAKKRSEIAPGVGIGTEMFTAGPALGTFSVLEPEMVRDFDRIYRKMKGREERSQRDAQKEVNAYVEERNKTQPAASQQKKPDDGSEPDGEGTPPPC